MKAVKLFIGFILVSLACIGQTPTGPQPVKTWFEYQKFNVKISLVPPRDTLSTADSGAIATKGNTVYVKNGKWRPVADTNAVIGSDTFYLTHIGTSASQINTIYAVHGGERASRWGDGLYMHVHLAADSLAFYDADTNFLATHAWVIAQYGVGAGGTPVDFYTHDGIFTSNRHVSMSGTHTLSLDSALNFEIKTSTTGTPHTAFRVGNNAGTTEVDIGDVDNSNGHTVLIVDDPNNQVAIFTQGVFKFRGNVGTANPVDLKTQASTAEYNLYLPSNFNYFVNDTLAKLSDVRGFAGLATLSGNGSSTTFTIAHGGAGGVPVVFFVDAASADAKNIGWLTADATNITVHYTTAPPSGTNNLLFNWSAKF